MKKVRANFSSLSFFLFSAVIAPQAWSAPEQVPGNVAAGQPAGAPAWVNIALMLGIVLFMWLFVFRPQSKRAKEQRAFLAALTPGLEVITAGGLIGTVVEVRDTIVSIDVGGSTVRVLKSSISGKLDSAPAQVIAR